MYNTPFSGLVTETWGSCYNITQTMWTLQYRETVRLLGDSIPVPPRILRQLWDDYPQQTSDPIHRLLETAKQSMRR